MDYERVLGPFGFGVRLGQILNQYGHKEMCVRFFLADFLKDGEPPWFSFHRYVGFWLGYFEAQLGRYTRGVNRTGKKLLRIVASLLKIVSGS